MSDKTKTSEKKFIDEDLFNPDVIRTNKDKIEPIGFYYDNQMNNPFLTMTLHPSTYQEKDENGKLVWKTYQEGFSPLIQEGEANFFYSKTPIAVALLTEDPSFSVSNNFTDWNGGNPIEGLFNAAKPYAAVGREWIKGIGEAKDSMKGTKDFGSSAVSVMQSFAKTLGAALDFSSNLLNKGLIVQGSRFSYYNGTNFSMNNLEFKFIKFSDYVYDKSSGKWIFQDVLEYMRTKLFPYCFGTYSKASENGVEFKNYPKLQDFIDKFCGFQSAPGGFEMKAKNLDEVIKGTLRLNVGGTYVLENLVIKNMNFILSKVQAKDPRQGKKGETIPLYAEISLTLSPACMITDLSFDKIIDPLKNGLSEFRDAKKEQYSGLLDKISDKRKEQLDSARYGLFQIKSNKK